MRLLILQTKAFKPNAAGVQRITYKIGRYFHEQGNEVFYYSTVSGGHEEPEFGELLYPHAQGGLIVEQNILHFSSIVEQLKPDIIMNQMPYERDLQKAINNLKGKFQFKSVGCLNNSLFSFRDNIKNFLSQDAPSGLNFLLNNFLGLGLIRYIHLLSHRKKLKQILRYHDFFVLPSPMNFDELNYFFSNYSRKQVFSIPNSIQSFGFKFNERFKKKTILYVGRIDVLQKRSDLLVPIWNIVMEKLPDWNFVIVGSGSYFETLKSEVESKKVERMVLMGHQNPESYYRDASIFVMPSAYEGFPSVLLEAQTFGVVPVVFDSYAAVSWILNNGVDAFIEPPFEVCRIAERIVEIASNPAMRNKMALNSVKNASRFHIDEVGRQWVNLFNTFISSPIQSN